MTSEETPRYDVALSFAGEDRAYVEAVATGLRERGVRVFYDRHEQAELWGRDLYEHLDYVYRKAARHTVLFVSRAYAERVWTNHERRSAQARALEDHRDYVLPARFDDTELPGLRSTIGYVDLRETPESDLVQLIVEKLGPRPKDRFFPPEPERLWRMFDLEPADDAGAVAEVTRVAHAFFETLGRLSSEEKSVIFTVFLAGCPAELPVNMHINADLLRRLTGFPIEHLRAILGGVQSLGFFVRYRPEGTTHPHDNDEEESFLGDSSGNRSDFTLEWHDMSLDNTYPDGNSTDIAAATIIAATDGMCTECSVRRLHRLDFSNLATVTSTPEEHIGHEESEG